MKIPSAPLRNALMHWVAERLRCRNRRNLLRHVGLSFCAVSGGEKKSFSPGSGLATSS